MDKGTVVADIDFIKDIVRRSHRRIDGHCFHSVHWGLIVLPSPAAAMSNMQRGTFRAPIAVDR